eukprot:CAMPEP_0182428980 /NCGR_PEP_ID=MMETSP1167-20130531/25204_1 /TAXON_ID=2988 /ORGANISM="Mallomonas Sp, Strain CCMP3275" /LENGTH=305 /DNA_ID=CAMNT_0024612249 /DNA_START=49 /DNA_END=966 /DNA_ORIENTATION=+
MISSIATSFCYIVIFGAIGQAFVPHKFTSKLCRQELKMGGKSLADTQAKSSKRKMFKSLREKFNKAAEIPGFFEVGSEQVDIDLYCKSNKDGSQIGDCPFAQFIQLVLQKKGVKYNLKPTISSAKPDWLLSKHEGKMPCLVHNDVSMTDSLAIAEYLEKTFPHSSLTRQGAFSYQEILEKTSGFFPAMSALIKNADEGKDAELAEAVEAQLDSLDELIRSTPGQYLCGLEVTLADLYLLPQLFHAMVALDHFKGIEFFHMEGDATRPALESYMERMLAIEQFNDKRVYYSVDAVIYGWKVARGEA